MNQPSASPWALLLALALPGTSSSIQPVPALPGLPTSDPTDAAARPRQLLRTAAALGVVARAGFQCPAWTADPPAPPAPPDTWPALGPTGANLLRQTSGTNRLGDLHFALKQLDRHHRRLPRPLLPWALERREVKELPTEYFHAAEVVGSHGPWLTRQHTGLAHPAAPPDLDQVWQQRQPYERRRLLERLLGTDPTRAYQLAANVLAAPATPNEQKKEVLLSLQSYQRQRPLPTWLLAPLSTCRANPDLTPQATRLLVVTEGNELLPRLWALVQSWVVPMASPAGPILRLTLRPAAWTDDWLALGLLPTFPYSPVMHQPAVELTGPAAWLYQALLLVPPTYWASAWGVAMPEAVALAAAAPEMAWLLPAWCQAAWLHRGRAAARPLLDHLAAQGQPQEGNYLDHLLTPDELADWMLNWIPGHANTRWPYKDWLWEATRSFILKECPAAVVVQLAALLRKWFAQTTKASKLEELHYALEQLFHTWSSSVSDPAAVAAMATLLPLAAQGTRSQLKYYLDQATFRAQFVASLAELPEPGS